MQCERRGGIILLFINTVCLDSSYIFPRSHLRRVASSISLSSRWNDHKVYVTCCLQSLGIAVDLTEDIVSLLAPSVKGKGLTN